jgi:teichuronic acid biosynthesis protein TuaE
MQVKRISIQLLCSLLGAIFLAYVATHYVDGKQINDFSLVAIGGIVAFIFMVIYKKYFWDDHNIRAILVAVLIATAFIGPGLVDVSVGPISLFPFRIMLGLTMLFVIYESIRKRNFLSVMQYPVWPILAFFIFWMLYGILSLSWTYSLVNGVKDFIFLLSGLLLVYLIGISFNKEKHFIEFYMIWVIMGLGLIFLGLVNHFLEWHLPISRISTVAAYQKHIPTAVFVNENDYASFLSITFFFLLSLLFYARSWLIKGIGVLGALPSLYLIVVTDSRANFLALIIGFAVWFLVVMNGRQRLAALAIFLPLSVGFVFTQYQRFEKYFNLILVQFESLFVKNELQPTSVDIRENLLKNVKIFIENTNGLGVGPGNAEIYMRDFFIYPTDGDVNIHNWWAEIFVEYGVLIFIGYILMFLYLMWNLFIIRRKAEDQITCLISSALFTSMCVFVLASISPNSFMTLNYNWLLIGFALSYINYKKRSKMQCSGGIMK